MGFEVLLKYCKIQKSASEWRRLIGAEEELFFSVRGCSLQRPKGPSLPIIICSVGLTHGLSVPAPLSICLEHC